MLRCALVSTNLDLRSYLGPELARIAGEIDIVDHIGDATDKDVRLAVAWYPPDDAFAHYPHLQAVCSIGAGVDTIVDCPSLRDDIDVVRVVDPEQARMMAGFIIWHVIGHQRQFGQYRDQQRGQIWQRLGQRHAADVPVGILGHGEIGQRVGTDLAHLGFEVMSWSRTEKPESSWPHFHGMSGLQAMLAKTEVLVNVLPLTPETRGLLGGDTFNMLRRGSYLIQVGRGEHLSESDLLAALDSGRLAGAALDVFATEPLPSSHPFWNRPDIVVTPHDASDVSVRAIIDTLMATAKAIRSGCRPPHAIDRARGY